MPRSVERDASDFLSTRVSDQMSVETEYIHAIADRVTTNNIQQQQQQLNVSSKSVDDCESHIDVLIRAQIEGGKSNKHET